MPPRRLRVGPTGKLACGGKMLLGKRPPRNCRAYAPTRPAAEGRAVGLSCGVRASAHEPPGLGAVCPSASCKGERDPDAYCREPANDRGEPYDFTSFIED